MNELHRASEPPTPMPSLWEQQVSDRSVALVSNWATFAKSVSLPNCHEEVHKPIMGLRQPSNYPEMIIHRKKGNQLGVVIEARLSYIKKLKATWGRFLKAQSEIK